MTIIENIIKINIDNFICVNTNLISKLKDKLNTIIDTINDISRFIKIMYKVECCKCFNEFSDEWKRSCIYIAIICDIIAGNYIDNIKITIDDDNYPEVNLQFKKDISSKDKVMILNKLSDEIEKISNGNDGLLDVSITIV